MPDLVSFYRWHLPDPLIFRDSFKATIQQIGFIDIPASKEDLIKKNEPAGAGWAINKPEFECKVYAAGLAERRDDYCAAAFLYCRDPQPVPRLNIKVALADIGLFAYEPRVD